MKKIGAIIVIIGMIALGLSTIGSVGYGLYLWGGLGGAFSASAWAGFLLWLKLVVGGLLAIVIGVLMGGTE